MAAKDHIPDWFLQQMDKTWNESAAALNTAAEAIRVNLSEQITAATERNCFYCMHFDHVNDTCLIAKPPSRPPVFILVHGCAQYHHEDNIPY